MNLFNVGDIIEATRDVDNWLLGKKEITKGKTYVVKAVKNNYVTVEKDDNGYSNTIDHSFFTGTGAIQISGFLQPAISGSVLTLNNNGPYFYDNPFFTESKGCNHQWKHYVGFTQVYDYCEKCDIKKYA